MGLFLTQHLFFWQSPDQLCILIWCCNGLPQIFSYCFSAQRHFISFTCIPYYFPIMHFPLWWSLLFWMILDLKNTAIILATWISALMQCRAGLLFCLIAGSYVKSSPLTCATEDSNLIAGECLEMSPSWLLPSCKGSPSPPAQSRHGWGQ